MTDDSSFWRSWLSPPSEWFGQRRRAPTLEPIKEPMKEAILRSADHSHNAAERYRDAYRAARQAQRVPITVAPNVSLRLVRAGKAIILHAGEEVLPDDFVGDSQEAVKMVLHRLLDERAVIALSDVELERLATPATARYIVADGGAISTKRGILDEGLEVRASDFHGGQADLDDLVRRGAIIDRQPHAEAQAKAKVG